MNKLAIPEPVADKLMELNRLVERNPVSIPLPEAAAFLEMDGANLRSSIEKGSCPFGISWQKKAREYRGFKIPTVPFYLWYTQGIGYRV